MSESDRIVEMAERLDLEAKTHRRAAAEAAERSEPAPGRSKACRDSAAWRVEWEKAEAEAAEAGAAALRREGKLVDALKAALPFLIRLGDFVGNGEGPTGNERCDAVLAVRQAIESVEGVSPTVTIRRAGTFRIVLDRWEGKHDEVGAVTVHSLREADDTLARWARSAPTRGSGYHKVGINVYWPDGREHKGRIDLQRDHSHVDAASAHFEMFGLPAEG